MKQQHVAPQPAAGRPQQTREELESPAQEREAQLQQASARVAELEAALSQARAELEQIARRGEEDLSRARKYGAERLANALLPIRDSLEKALAVDTSAVDAMREGMAIICRQLETICAQHGLVEIDPQPGTPFDPTRHQAVPSGAGEQAGPAGGAIAEVVKKGYLIGGRLLRPASVTFAADATKTPRPPAG